MSGVEVIGWDLKMGSYVVRVSRKKEAAVGRFRGLRSRVVFVGSVIMTVLSNATSKQMLT